MKQAISQLKTLCQDYPEHPLVIAFSGGVDSQVLLHLVCECLNASHPALLVDREIVLCHIHHGLSPDADKWLSFAKLQSEAKGVSFRGIKVSLDLSSGESIEALARDARYKSLASVFQTPAIILTGHHLNDQAETFLLALKRGAGVKGLSGMAITSSLGQHLLCRPLLNVSRADIEAYANEHKLEWVTDSSNADSKFDRNFIRNQVLPIATERWPSFVQTTARSAALCRENQLLVDELAEQDLNKIALDSGALDLIALSAFSQARFNNVIRFFLARQNAEMPSQAQLKELFTQLASEGDKVPAVKLGDVWARRFKQELFFTPDYQDISDFNAEVIFDNAGCSIVQLPDGLGQLIFTLLDSSSNTDKQAVVFSAPLSSEDKLSIRFTHQNPKISPDYRDRSRSLKKVLQELNIPTWERTRLPFIYCDDELVAVPSKFVCKPFLASEHLHKVQVHWRLAE
ncbi:MAG: tRNA lysidine(34) synthetase TilS [Colwelliaceae bacterium]|nr:tRNA lysidine(34) synthetase TilS [Colwelliaceae bacterium]